jgi:hypothetical protein
MRTLILNSDNIVEGTNNSVLEYEFSGGNINLKKGQKLALASLQMYYSTFNITALNQNNSFSYIWVDGLTYLVSIPDGFYDIPTLNNYLHFTMVQNGHYLITSTGDFVYLLTLTVNPTLYATELNCFGISAALAATNVWVLPAVPTWVLPTNFILPILVVGKIGLNAAFNSANFGLVIGFETGYYPNAVITGVPPAQIETPSYVSDQQFLSTFTPQVTPLSSFILTCSLINNNYAVPNNLIYSFAPQGTIGQQFTVAPNQLVFIDVLPAQYSRFQITFIDQALRPVAIQDPNMIIQLVISDPDEFTGI